MPIPEQATWCVRCSFPLTELRKIRRLPCQICDGRVFKSVNGEVRYVLRDKGITKNDKRFLKSLKISW